MIGQVEARQGGLSPGRKADEMVLKKTTEKSIEVQPIVLEQARVCLVGTARVVTHRFAEKNMDEMLTKQLGLTPAGSRKRDKKDPIADFMGGLYVVEGLPQVEGEFDVQMLYTMEYGVPMRLREKEGIVEAREGERVPSVVAIGRFGFPSVGLKAALATAGIECKIAKSVIHRTIRIPGELVELECEPGPCMRVDMVRLAGPSSVADIRFRPDFSEWSCNVVVQYDETVLKLNHVVELMRRAGFGVGIGEWRPEKGGQWGSFDVASVERLPSVEVKYKLGAA